MSRPGRRYANAPDVARFLVEGEPAYAGPWMLFTRPDWERWGRLDDYLRKKGEPSRLGRYAEFSAESARKYHEATYSVGLGAGRRFARQRNGSAGGENAESGEIARVLIRVGGVFEI